MGDSWLRFYRARYLVLSIGALACAGRGRSSEAIEAQPGVQFNLRVGQTAVVAGTPVTLTLERVKDDSRCPTDVICVWAGDALAIIRGSSDGDFTEALHLNVEPKEVARGDYTIRFVSLQPNRHSKTPVDTTKYVGTFVVENAKGKNSNF
jgi:hypothetical protein